MSTVSTILASCRNRRLLYEAADYNLTQATTDQPIQFDSSSMAVTVLVLFSSLFFLVFFSIYARRFFSGNHNAENPRRQNPRQPYSGFPTSSSTTGLDATAVRALPVLSYSSERKEQDGCAVCLSAFVEKEEIKVIPRCGHVFHPNCIDSWLLSHGSCPLCRCTELFKLSSPREGKMVRDLESAVLPDERESPEGRRDKKTELSRFGRCDSWQEPTDSRPSKMTRSQSF